MKQEPGSHIISLVMISLCKIHLKGRDSFLKAINIEWDIDDGDDVTLPDEIVIPEHMVDEDEISDYISDLTGYCHKGFALI